MPIKKWQDRRGTMNIYVTKQWPDQTRFRRVMPNTTVAKKTLARIEESIAMGTWRDLKSEFKTAKQDVWNPTVNQFSEVYLEEYCRTRNRRPDFKEETLSTICRIVGNIHVRDFKRSDAHRFVQVRSTEVRPATVNRGLAVLKNLLTFAIEKELIEIHPLVRFRMLPEPERSLRVLTEEEESRLVRAVYAEDSVVGALIEVLAETGLRISEALMLKWQDVDLVARRLTVDLTKSGKMRHVPVSERAVGAFRSLVRFMDEPHVFVRTSDSKPWRDPRTPFHAGRSAVRLEWVGFHDLRHYRATQWVKHGMPIREVQAYLGHSAIQTTMRYAHFSSDHAWEMARRIEQIEAANRERLAENWTTTAQDSSGR